MPRKAKQPRQKQFDNAFSTPNAADWCGVSESWMRLQRKVGTGPVYVKIGGRIVYLRADLDSWLASHRRGAA